MKALLLVAHGSRLTTSNDAIKQLSIKLRDRLSASDFLALEYAFLELTKPSIPQSIAKLVEQGATELVVMPYFLAPGTHVMDDIPRLIAEAELKYLEVSFKVMPYLGGAEGMLDLILDSTEIAMEASDNRG